MVPALTYYRACIPFRLARNISAGMAAPWIASSADVGEPYCIGFRYAIRFQFEVDAKMQWKPR